MSQEHRFCAEIYARLFNLIDPAKNIVISPDGQSSKVGGGLPDLCFTFRGSSKELRIEAKIVKKKRIILQSSQWMWFQDSPANPLNLWILADDALTKCWLFDHASVAKLVGRRSPKSINLWPNVLPPAHCSLDEIAVLVASWAGNNGFMP